MQLHEIKAVTATADPAIYVATVDITDVNGERYVTDYVSTPSDTFGLAPAVRSAVEDWLSDGRTVLPYTPPSAEALRASMPPLSPRQVRLGLLSIGITGSLVEAALAEDEAALIEWHYATSIERSHPLVESLADHFELPQEQVDSLWLWAAEL